MTVKQSPSAFDTTSRQGRIGIARLTKMAFDGEDFVPLWNRLAAAVQSDPTDTNALMDLSCIAQFMSDPALGARLQSNALVQNALYRSPCSAQTPRLRLLAFAAPTDIGGNTPVEFLVDGSDVQLETLYLAPGLTLPNPLPEHDIALVTIPDSTETQPMLDMVAALAPGWPRPILNAPEAIKSLDRDRLYGKFRDVAGLAIPATGRVSRDELGDIELSDVILRDIIADGQFPLIVRPAGSHAGKGLAKLDRASDIEAYLDEQPEDEFFVSSYVDYSGEDGQFRKYRIVFVDGTPYACHMAIADQWKIWYLNADMAGNAAKRAEEADFMTNFESGFGRRHAAVLAEIAARVGLEYFQLDCAETKDGRLLVFEADNAAIVHDMDPPDVFPYKSPQMRKVFDAFLAMLYKYARSQKARAA